MQGKLLTFILLFASIINISNYVRKNLHLYTSKFNPQLAEKKYNESQYVVPNSKKGISDGELYAYSGYKYLNGTNPLLLNAEHMTLGKYFIGVSILLTQNENIAGLTAVILSLFIFYFLSLEVTKSHPLSALSVLLLSFDSSIKMIIEEPTLLDIYQFFFLLLSVYFYIKWIKTEKKRYIFLTGIMVGFLSSVKFYLVSFVLCLVFLIHLFTIRKKIKEITVFYLILLPFSAASFLSTYIPSFLMGTSLTDFIKAQKWIFNFWRYNALNQIDAKGNILPLLLFNKWKIWWDSKGYIPIKQWNILYPLSLVLLVAITIFLLKLKTKQNYDKRQLHIVYFSQLFALWLWIYLLYLIRIPVYPRYLILYFPFVYLLIISIVSLIREPLVTKTYIRSKSLFYKNIKNTQP